MKIRGSFILSLAVLVFLVVVIYMSLGYRPKARLVPLVVAIPVTLLAVWEVGHEAKRLWCGQVEDTSPAVSSSMGEKEPEGEEVKSYGVFLWVVVLLLLIFTVGFIAGLPLFTFLYLRLSGRTSHLLAAGISLGLLLVIYLAFVMGLNVHFYQGFVLERIVQI